MLFSFEFILNVDMPSEFILTVPEQYYTPLKDYIPETPDDISVISPVYADMDWPLEINRFKATNKFDVMVHEGDDPSLDFSHMLYNYDTKFQKELDDFIYHGGKLSDLMMVKVYSNSSPCFTSPTWSTNPILAYKS